MPLLLIRFFRRHADGDVVPRFLFLGGRLVLPPILVVPHVVPPAVISAVGTDAVRASNRLLEAGTEARRR